jgi:hypothetical protein
MTSDPELHAVPPSAPADEALEDARALLIPVTTDIKQGFNALWLGNLPAAEDGAALQDAGITATLNVAVNISPAPLALPDGTQIRRYQIGMLDGAGNAPQTLAAAVQLLDGLAATYTQGKPHYPSHHRGGLLVHCRGGRSRSVTVLALWLHLRFTTEYPTLEAALAHLRSLRGLSQTYPLPPMIALAKDAAALTQLPK